MPADTRIPVALLRQADYDPAALRLAVDRLFSALPPVSWSSEAVLVKPNLVSRANAPLSCTRPEVARSVCEHLLDHGARPFLADSPAFGSAERVAAAAGYPAALAGLGLKVTTLKHPVPLRLPDEAGGGTIRTIGTIGTIGVARAALEADRIVSLAKVKAHGQFRATASTKNLFGCVCGCRKALAHMRLGDHPGRMEAMILALRAALPPALGLADGIEAMHRGGPIHGQPFPLGLLGAAPDTLALDTAIFSLLGLTPEQVPLWGLALERGLPGADPGQLVYPLETPKGFDATGFEVQAALEPMRFEPLRFVRGRMKSLLHRLK